MAFDDDNPNAANPYDVLLCGDCGIPYRDHTNEEDSAPCDSFHFHQDMAADLRADCADLWDANTTLRAELEKLRAELIEVKAELTDVEIERNNMRYRLNKLDIEY